MAMVTFLPLSMLYSFAYPIYAICLVLLVAVFILPSPGSTKRWIAVGAMRIQPSEIAKMGTVLALSKYLSGRKILLDKLRFFLIPFGLILVPMVLILREPDLGTSLVFAALLFPMLYWAGLKLAHLFFLLVPLLSAITAFHWLLWLAFLILFCGVIVLVRPKAGTIVVLSIVALMAGVVTPTLYDSLEDYQRKRIETFLDPTKDPLGAGYQIIQSKVAIGSGGAFGKGFLKGTQTKLAFLPAQHTDFIFSVISEEFGFVGALTILGLYLVMFWRGVVLASEAISKFAGLTAIGVLSILIFHVFVNIGMTIGIAPVTGLPLPFLSYGGSSLMVNGILVGLLLNIGLRRYEY
jgi:rod shape determining protein RodA